MKEYSVFSCLYLLTLATSTTTASAAEWKIEPALQSRVGYDDNITMQSASNISSAEIDITPTAKFSRETARSSLSGEIGLNFRRFLDAAEFNDNNARLGITSLYRLEKAEMSLDLSALKDTTLDSELDQTGLVFDRIPRLSNSINPGWTWNFDPLTRMTFEYTYTDVRYRSTSNTAFVDYALQNGQLTVARILNERSTTSLTAGQTFSDSENNIQSRFTFLQIGASYRFSEILNASVVLGLRRTRTEFDNAAVPVLSGGIPLGFINVPGRSETSSNGSVFSLSLSKAFVRGDISLSASRDVTNTISGILVEVTRISSDNRYNFSETLSGDLGLSMVHTQTTDQSPVSPRLDTRYFTVTPHIQLSLSRFFRISVSYRYNKQARENGRDEVRNAAYLTLTYQWPKIAVSR